MSYDETWTRLHELKALREADLSAFLGEKAKNGSAWNGAGVNEVRGMAASLASNPPSNMAEQADFELYRKCLDLARDLSNG